MSGGSPIARMAACLPEIDSAMTQSLVFDLVSRQEQLAVELEADRSELKRLKGHITSADESFQAFEASARTVFGAVSSSTAMLRRLANDLDENILSSPDNGQEYDSLAGGKPLPKIHNVDTDPGLFTKEHTPDLVQRLDDAFKGREEALKLFREEIKDPCQQLIWLKKHVYKLHADSQVGMSEWITVGALRAALWWKCDPNCKQDDETRNLDEVGFLKLPSRQGKHSPLVDDARDFIRTLAAVVEAWLEPKAPAGTWVRLGYKMEGSFRILVLGGGGSRRVVDEARLNALALQLDRAVRDGRRDRGGDLTNSLMALTRTNVYAPPKVTFVAGAVWDDSNGTELGIAWPAFPILSDEQRCQVVLRHVVVVRDDGSPESVKSMRLRFPCN